MSIALIMQCYMSVSWDVVEFNHVFFLILSIPLFEVTSAAIQQEWKQQQKLNLHLKIIRMHFMQSVCYLKQKSSSKQAATKKIKQDRMHSEASSVSNYEIYYENLKKISATAQVDMSNFDTVSYIGSSCIKMNQIPCLAWFVVR